MFRTGDFGYQDSDGYCYILDRLKDMIVTGGENAYSGEVEAVISEHPAVEEGAVFGMPDPQWVELVAACVVLKPGMALGMEDLIGYCASFWPITKFQAVSSSQKPSCRRPAPARSSRKFCGSVIGRIKNEP